MQKEDKLLMDVPGLIDRLDERVNRRGYLVYETQLEKKCKAKECTECQEVKTIESFPDETHQKAVRGVLQVESWHNAVYVEIRP